MLRYNIQILLFFMLFVVIYAAPAKRTHKEAPPPAPQPTATANVEEQALALQPEHVITIERFESLLRRAGEIFRPSSFQLIPAGTDTLHAAPENSQVAVYMQPPPQGEPYNFYQPLFDYDDNTKLDSKSRNMEQFVPPPEPSKVNDHTNYYLVKPKKQPKKFNGEVKHTNMKWLNAFEKQALADAGGEMPKAVYLMNDERNRINFDDSFFAVDMHVKTPDNQPHKEIKNTDEKHQQNSEEFLNQDEDDLLAAAAAQIPMLNFAFAAATAKKT